MWSFLSSIEKKEQAAVLCLSLARQTREAIVGRDVEKILVKRVSRM